jgi:3-phenylpropionate/trans-cinnamate dioxygenase ferredoxin component
MEWHFVTTSDKITSEAPVGVHCGEKKIAVFRVGDSYYATDNVCPHAYALLTDGFVEGDKIECPLHGAVFHIPTGRCLAAPAESDLTTYPVKLDGERILVGVEDQPDQDDVQ